MVILSYLYLFHFCVVKTNEYWMVWLKIYSNARTVIPSTVTLLLMLFGRFQFQPSWCFVHCVTFWAISLLKSEKKRKRKRKREKEIVKETENECCMFVDDSLRFAFVHKRNHFGRKCDNVHKFSKEFEYDYK